MKLTLLALFFSGLALADTTQVTGQGTATINNPAASCDQQLYNEAEENADHDALVQCQTTATRTGVYTLYCSRTGSGRIVFASAEATYICAEAQ